MMPGQPNFDRIARPYRALEYITLGRTLERTRLSYLPALSDARNALVLGDGDGRFLATLLAANPRLRAIAVDTSGAMLALLTQHCAAFADRLEIHQADALTFASPVSGHYDLVVTHFFLDCLTQAELQSLVERIAPMLTPRALWVVSDFSIPKGALRLPARFLVRTLYFIFRLVTGLTTTQLPDHTSTFTRASFTRIDGRLFLAGILTAELWQAGPRNL